MSANKLYSVEQLQGSDPDNLDLTGRKIGGLLVVRRLEDIKANNRQGVLQTYDQWECECRSTKGGDGVCGNHIKVSGANLRRDKSQKSCGCELHPNHKSFRRKGSYIKAIVND